MKAPAALRPSVPDWALLLHGFYSRMLGVQDGEGLCACAACGLLPPSGEVSAEVLAAAALVPSPGAPGLLLRATLKRRAVGVEPPLCAVCSAWTGDDCSPEQ